MKKIDLKKELKQLYKVSAKEPSFVSAPPMNYLMVDGKGHPEGNVEFENAMGALFGMAYTMKFMKKQSDSPADWVVMPLEGLWTHVDHDDPSTWQWTMMIMQPDVVTPELFDEALAALRQRKGDNPAFDLIRLERLDEGECAHIMHLGPYDNLQETVDRLHQFIKAEGKKLNGLYHDVYLSDPRRAKPENLKTVVRFPVK